VVTYSVDGERVYREGAGYAPGTEIQLGSLMRSLWGEPRPPDAPGRSGRDWTVAGVFAALAIIEGLTRPDLPGGLVAVALAIGLTPTLLWRRRRPLLTVTIAFAATGLAPLLTHGVPPEGYSLIYLLLLPYSLVRWGSGREIVLGTAVILVKVAVSIVVHQMTPADALAGAAVTFAVGALGLAVRYRSRERAREFDQVRLRERERLARDLHDTVAHHVSAMAIRAQAGLATAAQRPEAATEALLLIEAEAARALAEMRAVVRVLRDDDADRPYLTDLARLAEPVRDGPPVDLAVDGDLGSVAPAVGAALYRMAQEAVTNARRHARHATRIEIRVAADDRSVHLRVTDDGDVRGPDREGFGLTGMRERAVLLGGVCTAGPNADRGWSVTATLPRTGAAA
jgi:signal transduction histidine kinase